MSSETHITTVRHAYTEYNTQRRYAGSIDVPLSETGRRQAEEIGLRLAQASFDVVITSPLKRARQTAEILCGSRVRVVVSPLCTERNFGIMEGLTWDDIRMLQPPVMLIQVGNELHTVNPRGGEPFEDVWQRAKAFRKFIFEQYSGSHVLVVSHGVFLQLFNGLLKGLSCIESLAAYPGNLELARFRFEGQQLIEHSVVPFARTDVVSW